MKLRGYEKYKASGVEWLGDVPEHWVVKAIKWETPVFRGASPRPIDDPNYFDDEGEYAWVRIADVTASGMFLTETTQRLSDLGDQFSVRLEPGALFLSIAGTVGKPCIAGIKCCIHDGFVHFPNWRGDTKFLFYIFASGEPYRGLGKFGTQLNLNTDTVGSIQIGFPPLLEQRAIANFLDSKTADLDKLTARKRDLLERLREQRTALISRTVTKGLPEVEARAAGVEVVTGFKDSGVEWLGDVPEHWELPPMYVRYQIELGKMLDESRITGEYLVPYLKNADVQWDSINFDDLSEMDIRPHEFNRFTLRVGDLLVCEGGEVGRTAVFNENTRVIGFQKALHRLRPARATEHPRFMYYTLFWASQAGVFLAEGNPNTIPHLTGEKLRVYRFPTPPLLEQRAIANYLDRETGRIDHLITRVEAALEQLTEYRAALITAAVTGRVDVREALTEKDGMLIFTGAIDNTKDFVTQARLERDEQVLGS